MSLQFFGTIATKINVVRQNTADVAEKERTETVGRERTQPADSLQDTATHHNDPAWNGSANAQSPGRHDDTTVTGVSESAAADRQQIENPHGRAHEEHAAQEPAERWHAVDHPTSRLPDRPASLLRTPERSPRSEQSESDGQSWLIALIVGLFVTFGIGTGAAVAWESLNNTPSISGLVLFVLLGLIPLAGSAAAGAVAKAEHRSAVGAGVPVLVGMMGTGIGGAPGFAAVLAYCLLVLVGAGAGVAGGMLADRSSR